ncbi:MAG: hypothetical protein ABI053_00670 [Lacisediminihabitans sp.]
MEQELPRAALGDLRVDEVAEGRWQVIDRRFRATNPRALLGFIQQHGARFEATDLRHSNDPVTYGSQHAAIVSFLPASSAARTPSHMDAEESLR